jgi:flagellar biosynthesis/type III secretory pathway protein FliH
LFRARLADAFDAALARLLRELATDVLARELRMAPCDLAALVARLCAQAPGVRVRVAPSDISAEFGLPCVADPALESGDAILEVDGGVIDARLGVRLALLLERS